VWNDFIQNEVALPFEDSRPSNFTDPFLDPDSYQSKALTWLCGPDGVPAELNLPQSRVAQRWVLACLYYATFRVSTVFTDEAFPPGFVPPWANSFLWLTSNSECVWSKIACNPSNEVQIIDMFQNSLTGEFPFELVRLNNSIEILDIGETFPFAYPEVETVLGQMFRLRELRYEDTNFISFDGIPNSLGNLKSLEFLSCSNVLYAGALDPLTFPSDMVVLEYLDLEFNTYQSAIPPELMDLPALRFLYIRGGLLTGNIDFLPNGEGLVQFWVDENRGLGGPIPTEIGSMTALSSLSLSQCTWSGIIPTELALRGPFLQSLFLNDNQLSGTIPTDFAAFTGLQFLTTVDNPAIVGPLDFNICTLRFSSLGVLTANCPICLDFEANFFECCTNDCT